MTTVLIADDQALLRSTFALLIDSTPDLAVVAQAGSGAEAHALAREHRPDVVLMDIRMPGVDGIEGTRLITSDDALASTKVLVLTTFESEELVLQALIAGASGFLGKSVEPVALLDGIRTVAAGDQLLSPAATRSVIARVLDGPAPETARAAVPGFEYLTEREREIVGLVATGASNEEIGARLVISPTTVKTHVNRAMAKTSSRDRAQLVVRAYQAGLA